MRVVDVAFLSWVLHVYVVCCFMVLFSGFWLGLTVVCIHTSHTHLLSYTLHHLSASDVPRIMLTDGKYCTNIEYLRVFSSVISLIVEQTFNVDLGLSLE